MTGLWFATFPIGGMFLAFRQSDWMGKSIVIVLFAGSILAWSLMVTKYRQLRAVRNESRGFLAAYRKEKQPLGLFVRGAKFPSSPLYAVYETVCRRLGDMVESEELSAGASLLGERAPAAGRLTKGDTDFVRNAAERTAAHEALLLEEGMNWLAIAVSAAPFLGLFGTVWGVMLAFGLMTSSGTAMLKNVAPGISGALLTTVVGLIVALPASIGYNLLSEQIRRIGVVLDNFSEELMADIERHYG